MFLLFQRKLMTTKGAGNSSSFFFHSRHRNAVPKKKHFDKKIRILFNPILAPDNDETFFLNFVYNAH